MERGVALSKQYGVDHLLQPIFDFTPSHDSPPLAPKHVVAAPNRSKRKDTSVVPAPSIPAIDLLPALAGRRMQGDPAHADSDAEMHRQSFQSEERSFSPAPSDASSSSQTPSPLGTSQASGSEYTGHMLHHSRKRKHGQDGFLHPHGHMGGGGGGPARYARMILDYFVSESSQVPGFLISPPPDFDPNVVIDDDGHTALHWACAMGRIRIVKLLLTAGADIFRANAMGQTALMRSVMFTNNYDLRKFPELFELLHRSTINIDRNDRTVFHYVVDIALQKGKTHAARYYAETILGRLSEYPREVADILNFQDEDGETALTLAARARSKRLVKVLLDYGADPKLANRDGKSAEDYILEDERFRASSLGPGVAAGALAPGLGAYVPALHTSETGQRASGTAIPAVAEMLENLASSFDNELGEKERDLRQAHSLLGNIQAEILDSGRTVAGLKDQAAGLEELRQREAQLQGELNEKMGKRFRLGWEKYTRDEEEREKEFVANRPAQSQPETVDLDELLKMPDLPEGVAAACDALRGDLMNLKGTRRDLFESFVDLQAETGTGQKMGDYRKLIGLGCNVSPAEVDALVPALSEALEAEEHSADNRQ
jgi:transcription factor MBP1